MNKVAIIGAGNMGSAIVEGIWKKYRIVVSDVDKNKLKRFNIGNNIKAVRNADMIILAVKPQNMDSVLNEIKGVVNSNQLVVSIAAGIKTRRIEGILGKVPVVRVMPNTPLLVGMGMSAICHGRYAKSKHLRDVDRIFSTLGKVLYIKEPLMDAVTAVSGSGPAYVYLFIESLIKSASGLGLTKKDAETLVLQTLKGALALLEKSRKPPEELRRQVTSPGGTTEAALKIFQKKRFDKIICKALNSAFNRAGELT